MDMPYIAINNLTYKYPGNEKITLNNININIERGDIVLVCGNSGSGKSTLGKCIAGSVPNFYGGTVRGEIKINNKNIKEFTPKELAEKVTMVFQDPERQLLMNKVHREVAFGLENIGIPSEIIKRRVYESMEFCGIEKLAERDIVSLSGGEKQKVAVTSALAYMPECIIFDEPTSQLDPNSAEEIINIISKINEELGITIVLIEQRMEKCFSIADKILLINQGAIDFYGDKDHLYKSNGDDFIEFMPQYLKLSKILKFSKMPLSIRETRKKLNNFNFRHNSPIEKEKHIEEPIIKISNLCFSYDGNANTLKNINININKGEFVEVMGPNGAGKSTLFKSMMGFTKYKGSIKLFGKEVSKYKRNDLIKSIGYISQNPNDYISKETVYDEIKFTLDNYGIKDYELIDVVLKDLGIDDLKYKNPRDISGGEKQRVAIASILVMKPEIILLDEPTRGLDFNTKKLLGNTLKKLNKKGSTIIMITHDIEFAAEFADKFILLFNGEAIQSGTKEEVFKGGTYYNTSMNKLFRNMDDSIFTIEDVLERLT
ncbi:ABC transporter ATP-binding protein [Clostridium sp. JN-9]|uniref:ABC transporter ATP-binding protein n=1 Tax=Clostridium sp. JN-9 TaxID=2507159 RepID=UPI001FAB2FC8|nr:ABC transporter ATP-binding protein [Clostridium sp. JN-9]